MSAETDHRNADRSVYGPVDTPSELSVARGAGRPLPAESLLDRFDHWVAATPDAACVLDGPFRWSFREVDQLSREVARTLSDGAAPGDIVAVALDRCLALVSVAVAVARCGMVYLPLGPQVGAGRIGDLLDRIRITAVIGPSGTFAGRGREVPVPVAADGANAVPAVTATFLSPAPNTVPAPADSCYAVLTSGSSGTPKAVAVGATALANAVSYYNETAEVRPGDRLSLMVAAQFDPHISELWCGLSAGAGLTIAPDPVRYDPAALMAWVGTSGLEVGHFATPVAERVLTAPWPAGLRLRTMFIGGERLRRRPRPDVTAEVFNVYGPAEAIIATGAHIEPGAEDDPPPIGKPVPAVDVCVVDADGRLVARGVAGELLIGGRCLSEGYLDPELTGRRFGIGPPGSGLDRIYRTGDRVRMRADGVLDYLGRLDAQLKISGVRIEPAEVEAALERQPGVGRAVVAVRDHEGGGRTLVAFIRPVGERLDVDALLTGARSHLLEQAVPGEVHLVDSYPLNANGKVDVAALFAGIPVEAPATELTPTEQQLALIWQDILEVEEVHRDSNLFELGGNSIDAFRLSRAIKDRLGVQIPMKSIMTLRTLAVLAAAVEAAKVAHQPVAAEGIVTEW